MSNETQDKVNELPIKSFNVLAAVIPAMYDDESSCYLEDVNVEGMNIHAITGTLPHLTAFITSCDLAASGSGNGYMLELNAGYDVYSLNAAIKARLNAPVEETPVEEEAQTIRVTPPQGDALRALGYEVRSCKLRYSSSQAEEILDSLYAERKLHTGAQRRVYTSIIYNIIKYTLYLPKSLNTRLNAPVEETPVEEEARCYHVTRCEFDPRGNPSAWATDSSYSTLDEARARFAELVAELGGGVDPSSLSAHSCETVGDVGIQLVYDTLPARDNTKTYVGAHNGAYLYETSQEEEATQAPADLPVEEEELEPLVKGLPETPVEEEAQTIRVTPPQVDALRALGYDVKSCKLRYSSSQAGEILDSLYAERKLHTGAQRRVYTSIIDKVSQETKQAPNVALLPHDLRIEYRSLRAQRQILELIDAAESAGIVSRGSASTLRASCTPCTNIIIRTTCAYGD